MGKTKKKEWTLRRPNKGWLAGSSATQTICISFLLVIAVGTLLLTLPISSRTGRLGVIDAMFTATSATCVTGLIVRDTWSQFSLFGQVVILMLIQVGGLGLVTLTSFLRWQPGGGWASATCGCWARASRQMACPRLPRC